MQRTPEYCNGADSAEVNPPTKAVNLALGRRFRIVSVRWLNPTDL